MNAKYLQAVAQQDLAAALAALTAQIQRVEAGTSTGVPLARLYSNRAYWHIRLEYNRKALKDLNEALRLQPQMLDAQIRRGEVLVALNKIDEAVRQWRAALETATANPECDAAVLACIHSYLQQPEQAKLQGKQQASAAADSAASLAASPAASRTAAPASATSPAKPPASRQGSAGAGVETSSRTSSRAASAEQELLAAAAAAGSGPGPAPSFLQAIEAQQRLQQCIELINDCKYHEAEFKLNDLVRSNATSTAVLFQAKVCLGTCKAQRHQLPEALKDFSAAIEIGPQVVDAWKRRSQVKGALGDMEGALADLGEAMKLAVDAKEKAALHFERGSIHHGRSNHRSAREDFEVVVKLDPGNVSAWNSLGHSRTAMGDIELGVQAYDTAISLDSTFRDAFFNKGYALKEQGKVKDAERALLTAIGMDTASGSQMRAFRLLVHMRQCQGMSWQKQSTPYLPNESSTVSLGAQSYALGEHAKAIQVANKALQQGRAEQRVELLYLKAICHHALGDYFQAFQAYTDAASIALPPPAADAASRELEGKKRAAGGGGGDDALHMQYLSWYQREMAAYMYTVLNTPVNEFCIDRTLHPKFKEDWCRKAMPQVLVYGKTWPKIPVEPPKQQLGGVDEAALAQLLPAADALGQLLQNTHQGFVSNRRQQRAAGLAALELAQMVCRVVAERRKNREVWVKSQGASGGVGSDGRHQFGWRDAMDIVVRWRQLAEPNDQVVWVDLLSKEEFTRGFGSHTPMFTGQTQCVRYYMNFQRAFDLFRRIVLEKGHAFDGQDRAVPLGSPDAQAALKEAKHCAGMFDAIGSDCWVVVPVDSSRGGGAPQLEGTRLTLVRFPPEVQPDAYEFSIRTPVTPPRWAAFDAELEHAWARLNSALIEEDALEAARWIMLFGYYWYNFMPLARGSAAVGYTTMLALFWVAGMPVTASIPADYQVDWEAILAPQPQAFLDSVSPWMWPGQVKGDGQLSLEEQAKQEAMGLPEQLPDVLLTLSTNRQRINALNHPDGPWV